MAEQHICELCQAEGRLSTFTTKFNLSRHIQQLHQGGYTCAYCSEDFSNGFQLNRHLKTQHEKKKPPNIAKKDRKWRAASGGQFFRSQPNVENQPQPKKSETIICPYCAQHFRKRIKFLDHINARHARNIGSDITLPLRLKPNEPLSLYLKTRNKTSTVSFRQQAIRAISENPFDFVFLTREWEPERSNKFKLLARSYELALNELGSNAAQLGCILSLIDALLANILQKMAKLHTKKSPFYVSFSVNNADILDFPITTPFLKTNTPTSHAQMLAEISLVGTSKPALFVDRGLTIEITCLGIQTSKKDFSKKMFGGAPIVCNEVEYVLRKNGCFSLCPNILWANDCLLVAVVMAIKQKQVGKKWKQLQMFQRPFISKELKRKVFELAALLPSVDWNFPQDIGTCESMQNVLNRPEFQYQLCVHHSLKNSMDYFFCGHPKRNDSQKLHILLVDRHMTFIYDLEAFYFLKKCPKCYKYFKKRSHKQCFGPGKPCSKCKTRLCSGKVGQSQTEPLICSDCNGYWPTQACFEAHKDQNLASADALLPVCTYYIYCVSCGMKQRRNNEIPDAVPSHSCLLVKCRNCKDVYQVSSERHLCAIQKPSLKELGIQKKWAEIHEIPFSGSSNFEQNISTTVPDCTLKTNYVNMVGSYGLVFFDVETRVSPETGKLVPFALTAMFCCSECCFDNFLDPQNYKTSYPCCSWQRKQEYVGILGIKEFVLNLFFNKSLKNVVAFAFYGRGFDFLFILDMLVDNGLKPKIRMKGRQIIQLSYNHTTLKDLHLYISGSLSQLPENFGFAHVIEKGFFPHLLSSLVQDDYKSDSWPGLSYFQPHLMASAKSIEALKKFLEQKKGQPFVFMTECLKYCWLDTLVLALTTLLLERECLKESGYQISFICSSSFTLAGLSAIFFRQLFMKENSIGQLPASGYTFDRQSETGQEYFAYLNSKLGAYGAETIRYSGNSIKGEFRWQSFKVDGATSYCLLEYHGCFYHADTCCFGTNTTKLHPLYGIPIAQVQYLDNIRLKRISNGAGLPVRIIRECEVKKLKKTNPSFRLFSDAYKLLCSSKHSLHVRDALFGGRTEQMGIVMELTAEEIKRGVKIELLDVVSLYPFCQFKNRYPGKLHPELVEESQLPNHGVNFTLEDAQSYFGVFAIFIVPPGNLLFPSVPYKCRGKTIFGLCRTCMEQNEQNDCTHQEYSQRGFHATLNSVDLEQALKEGYLIPKCYQLLDWGRSATTTDLFTQMISKFIKGKVQSKEDIESLPIAEKRTIKKEWGKIGVQLDDISNWKGSAARYTFFKILLNSLWGKLAQKTTGYQKTELVDSWSPIEKILGDSTRQLTSIHLASPKLAVVQHRSIIETNELSGTTPVFYNPFIASLVTSYSRRKMCQYMQQIGANHFYIDTDSLIFKADPLCNDFPRADPAKVLGNLVSELPKGHFIRKIVVLSPKSYCYDIVPASDPFTSTPTTVIKLKGISLKFASRQLLTTSLLEEIALNELTNDHVDDFMKNYAKMSSDGFVDRAKHIFKTEKVFALPQPGLKKSRTDFSISEDNSVKRLSCRFDKRRLLISKICHDFGSFPKPSSVPFGYIFNK